MLDNNDNVHFIFKNLISTFYRTRVMGCYDNCHFWKSGDSRYHKSTLSCISYINRWCIYVTLYVLNYNSNIHFISKNLMSTLNRSWVMGGKDNCHLRKNNISPYHENCHFTKTDNLFCFQYWDNQLFSELLAAMWLATEESTLVNPPIKSQNIKSLPS